jgi:branched-chain amino acid transport system ATP-binding protein
MRLGLDHLGRDEAGRNRVDGDVVAALLDRERPGQTGRIVLEGSAEQLRSNSDIREFYLGLNEAGSRKSYRDVKRYKRRKRWLS